MAPLENPKLPRVTLRGENLYVEGEKEPYFRDPEGAIWLRVDALTIHRGYEPEDYPFKRTGKFILTEFLIPGRSARRWYLVANQQAISRLRVHDSPMAAWPG
jgi:hypothetical protein